MKNIHAKFEIVFLLMILFAHADLWSMTTQLPSGAAALIETSGTAVDSDPAEIVYAPTESHYSGELSGDTTWSGTCILDATVVVPDGNTLTIESGTVVSIAPNAGITVYGRLMANGTESQPVRFTHSADGTTWERIMFIEAGDSVLEHCIIEYADCEGDHKDYYDNDCDPDTPLPSRTYFQAVVAIASHVDIDGCLFHKLPDDSSSPEGDAIAIISDDPDIPGDATANIRDCSFISIGQGVHTRYSYVLIENCYFTGHHGDNDDIDLYGESVPPPLVLNNVLVNPAHDDMINPTRCSAVIVGNIVAGCDDHGIVLRDKSYPILINNLIYNCSSAGIAVQNQCDALLVNNTILNCGRGVRFFDHTGRWGPPYCLFPGSGKATIVNCIIWDCPTSIALANSPYTEDRGSHATVLYCDIEGGQGSASVSSNSTLTWGDGNIDQDPLFADPAGGDLHLKSVAGRWDSVAQAWVNDALTSPCIDAGTSYLVDDPNYGYFGTIDWRGELWPHGAKINMGAYGGAAQASMSNDTEKGNVADIDYDGLVAMPDFAQLARNWKARQTLLAENLDRNEVVDFRDVLEMSREWLWQEIE